MGGKKDERDDGLVVYYSVVLLVDYGTSVQRTEEGGKIQLIRTECGLPDAIQKQAEKKRRRKDKVWIMRCRDGSGAAFLFFSPGNPPNQPRLPAKQSRWRFFLSPDSCSGITGVPPKVSPLVLV